MKIMDFERFNQVKQNIEERFELCMYLSHTKIDEDRIIFPNHFSENLIREILCQVMPKDVVISQIVELPMPLSQTLVVFAVKSEFD